ncbi:hypothetical protein DPMN_115350 [Dreissena polymorpha]|uniref:Uncharacterized protein n=1 Tax=Dreissena polymorpha TaxID=45954 RepID=A0A9D4KLT5_DREPO|nr:hypothetical protein DPMN_115350 [Dreissena polymorpha]
MPPGKDKGIIPITPRSSDPCRGRPGGANFHIDHGQCYNSFSVLTGETTGP